MAWMPTRRPPGFATWPIRRKLQAMVLLPLVVVLPLLGGALLLWATVALDRLLISRVQADLAVAHGYFDRVQAEVAGSTAAVADSHALQVALAAAQAPGAGAQALAALRPLLAEFRRREGLDYINLRGPDGRWLLADDPLADDPQPAPVAPASTRVQAALAVLAPAQQGALGPDLRTHVAVALLPTLNARPTQRRTDERALVLQALAPVRDAQGQVLAQLQAGMLLNRNLPFIDHINTIVYPEGGLPFGSRGTATLFLDDVRISTNVRLFADAAGAAASGDGEARAIGTRVSQAVAEAVLGRGDTWLGRAFVVNDWYVSAYQPLHDAAGQRVAMLYVGFTERPFTWLKYGVLAGIGALTLGSMVVAALWSARWARQIFRPVEQMAQTMQQVEQGVLNARVGPLPVGDEIGALAGHLDHLLDTIAGQTTALQQANQALDAKVAQRTAALAAAQQQLLRTEKMAAVGQLTASIAHEVNNPIAVIQGNLDLARELLGPAGVVPIRDELALVDQQIERMRLIVTQLLQFARPADYAGYVEPLDAGRALDDCLVLAQHQLGQHRITVQRRYQATHSAGINRQELQQVLVNLLVNAGHAMPEGGTLSLATADWADAQGRPGVAITVADTGAGLDEALLGMLFQPFVTRKKDGTGLGLWISRSIVERYGGDIVARNRPPAADGTPAGAELQVLLLSEPAGSGATPVG